MNKNKKNRSVQKWVSKLDVKKLLFLVIISVALGFIIGTTVIYSTIYLNQIQTNSNLSNENLVLQNQNTQLERLVENKNQDEINESNRDDLEKEEIEESNDESIAEFEYADCANEDFEQLMLYANPYHNFTFSYPDHEEYVIHDGSIMGSEVGQFGTGVSNSSCRVNLDIKVIYTEDWSTVGNKYGDVDSLEQALQEGGVERVAELSREVNTQKEKNMPDKEIGDLTRYDYSNGSGYGFTVTESLSTCFNVDVECGSGYVLNDPVMNVIYVSNGKDVYRVTYPVNSLGGRIFSTLSLPE